MESASESAAVYGGERILLPALALQYLVCPGHEGSAGLSGLGFIKVDGRMLYVNIPIPVPIPTPPPIHKPNSIPKGPTTSNNKKIPLPQIVAGHGGIMPRNISPHLPLSPQDKKGSRIFQNQQFLSTPTLLCNVFWHIQIIKSIQYCILVHYIFSSLILPQLKTWTQSLSLESSGSIQIPGLQKCTDSCKMSTKSTTYK